jgi:NAD(P)-dependent dehydrogenase (short-subunit alcohol dehydrogenase family)
MKIATIVGSSKGLGFGIMQNLLKQSDLHLVCLSRSRSLFQQNLEAAGLGHQNRFFILIQVLLTY